MKAIRTRCGILAAATTVATIVMSSLGGTMPAHASPATLSQPSTTGHRVCLENTMSCIDGQGVGFSVFLQNPGESLHSYPASSGGKVTSTWPFKVGLGLNTKYEGDGVYYFCVYNETSHCLKNNTSSQLVYTASVSGNPGSAGWFVDAPAGSSGGYIISVGETNYKNNRNSYGMSSLGNGHNIYDYYIHLAGYFHYWY